MQMSSFFFNFAKILALLAAVVALPILAHLAVENSKGDGVLNHGNHNDDHSGQDHGKISTVPDNGPGVAILAGSVGAVLLFSARMTRINA